MPDRVKCLHALAGYALAVGPGVIPAGDEALELAGWDRDVCNCDDPRGESQGGARGESKGGGVR